MKEKHFFYLIGSVSFMAWILYFLLYSSLYSNREIIEALVFVSVVVLVYFIITVIYFRS